MEDTDITSSYITLLRKMGHDMRVPLNTLISTSDMMVSGLYGELTTKQEKAAIRLQRNSHRLLFMLDDFVTYIKASANDLEVNIEPLNLREKLIDWSNPIRLMLEENGVTLSVTVNSPEQPTIACDEALLKRIVQALLWNAASFTMQGQIQLTGAYHADEKKWLIDVKDSGTGIPHDDQPHIFEPFWRGEGRPQVPTAGAGLGLPLAQALLRLLKGSITLKATSEQGTWFCVELPDQPA